MWKTPNASHAHSHRALAPVRTHCELNRERRAGRWEWPDTTTLFANTKVAAVARAEDTFLFFLHLFNVEHVG